MIEIIYLPVDKIHPNDYNPNVMTPELFEALCEFVQNHPPEELDPIWVRVDGDGYEIIDGESRWKAASKAGWKQIRGFILPLNNDQAKVFNIRKNRERGTLDAIKLGEIWKELNDNGKTEREIAEDYGYEANTTINICIDAYQHKQEIFERLNLIAPAIKPISYTQARRVLREIKREERANEAASKITEQIAETFAPVVAKVEKEKAELKNSFTFKQDSALKIIGLLVRNLQEGRLFCPHCGKPTAPTMLEWSCCHKTLTETLEVYQNE